MKIRAKKYLFGLFIILYGLGFAALAWTGPDGSGRRGFWASALIVGGLVGMFLILLIRPEAASSRPPSEDA
ncbi:MAG TPA: hypothetical protein PK360_09325 [bacterium]|nr:hypothetical protein [bacterium]